jgi:hypothetical protein
MAKTDHSETIKKLRDEAAVLLPNNAAWELLAAADILEVHDATGLSLDNWRSVRNWIEGLTQQSIQENGA